MKLTRLPRNASEAQPWLDFASDAISQAAVDPDDAFERTNRLQNPDCSFEELAVVPRHWASMNVKIRAAMGRLTIGGEADKTPELVSLLSKRRDELRRAAKPQQITGLQMIYLVKLFTR